MAPQGPRPRSSRRASGLPPITAAQVIAAATELTRQHGLDGWTIRQLANALDVWPGVVYHHVGGRDAVTYAVTDRVVGAIPVPGDNLTWQDWFRKVLSDGRLVLRQYRGVARRLVIIGPTVPAALPTIDLGIQLLQRAGFGAEAPTAYRYLFNSAFMLIAVEDDRDGHPRAREHVAEVLGAYRADAAHAGLAAVGAQVQVRKHDPESLRDQEEEFYEYSLSRCIAGVERLLSELSGGTGR
jgi:AcrR family transcriptional regulator